MFDHFGTRQVERPWGELTRYKLFDLPWDEDEGARDGWRRPLSHGLPPAGVRAGRPTAWRSLQAEIYRSLANFVQEESRANRLMLMHGPNGSAKSTVAAAILRALEHYSTLEEGALYRFHWVFPSRKTVRGALGFDGSEGKARPTGASTTQSYAHLDDDQIDSRLVIELRDHPLFLLPIPERRALVQLALHDRRRQGQPPRLADERQALAQEPAGLRGAPLLVQGQASPRRSGTCRSSATSSRGATASAR